MDRLTVSFKSIEHTFEVSLDEWSLAEFANAISRKTGVDPRTVKLAAPKRKLIRCSDEASAKLREAGLTAGAKLLLLGSTAEDVAAVRAARDMPGLAGFDHELRLVASRRRQSTDSERSRLPTGPYTFGSFEAWNQPGLRPPPAEALKLLHKLASDPGIAGIMRKYGWAVGKLSEMPPQGKVGVSPVCILGVNHNAGQEISLRLRTDDLKGFRRYLSIRQTLCHELAHMVYSEHDANFKRLNSQLCAECSASSVQPGVRLFEAAQGWDLNAPPDPADVMSATATSSGQTLRQLAGNATLPPLKQDALTKEEATIGVEALGHRDAVTEAKEQEAEQLGSTSAEDAPTVLDEFAASSALQEKNGTGHEDQSNPIAQSAQPALDATFQQSKPPSAEPGVAEPTQGPETELPAPQTDQTDHSDPSRQYYEDARSGVEEILRDTPVRDALAALQTLSTILKNALNNPAEQKFRRVRQRNPAFFSRAGRFEGSLALLRTAGFVAAMDGQEEVLQLARNDPGLLWISLSACESALLEMAAA